jgi:hypothetical protein
VINVTNGKMQYADRWSKTLGFSVQPEPMLTEKGSTRTFNPTFGWMEVSQVKTAQFSKPCPPQYNYAFPFTQPYPIKQGWKNTSLWKQSIPAPRKGQKP